METPLVQVFLACEQIITDQRTNRRSFINVLDNVSAPAFPLSLSPLTVYVSLTNGNGRGTSELRCMKEDTEEVILSLNGPVEFASPAARLDLVYELGNFVIKEPGVYALMFYCDSELLMERRFHVTHSPMPPFPPPPGPPHMFPPPHGHS